jgi:tRNA(adenine34) deaminase
MRRIDIARHFRDLWVAPRRWARTKTSLDGGLSTASAEDLDMMARCIELSRIATREGELPFACVICRDGKVVVEVTNQVSRDGDVTRHAELVAISSAQRILGRKRLAGCTLYSNVEPCVMCSLPVRESRISRVVFSIKSPLMGGFSRWNVLDDSTLSSVMMGYVPKPPEIVPGILMQEAEAVWREWNPLIWGIIRKRGIFGGHFDLSGDDTFVDGGLESVEATS